MDHKDECFKCHNYVHIAQNCGMTRSPRPRLTKVWKRKSEVQTKKDEENLELEVIPANERRMSKEEGFYVACLFYIAHIDQLR